VTLIHFDPSIPTVAQPIKSQQFREISTNMGEAVASTNCA
jgi:hypothetical protein